MTDASQNAGEVAGRPYRLVWFQHFHKAAGTSIIELARRNGERFYPRHENGNPVGGDGRPLALWRLPAAALSAFVDDCQRQGVSFVATEWGVPALETLADDPRVVLVTCLRHPLQRLISNYYYDLYGGYTAARRLDAYPDSSREAFCRHNYYCRMLAGKAEETGEIGEQDFLRARARLACFDHCDVVERGLEPLAHRLGWTIHAVHENKSDAVPARILKDLCRGRWRQVLYRIVDPKRQPEAAFCTAFARLSEWDLRLYELVEQARGRSQGRQEAEAVGPALSILADGGSAR